MALGAAQLALQGDVEIAAVVDAGQAVDVRTRAQCFGVFQQVPFAPDAAADVADLDDAGGCLAIPERRHRYRLRDARAVEAARRAQRKRRWVVGRRHPLAGAICQRGQHRRLHTPAAQIGKTANSPCPRTRAAARPACVTIQRFHSVMRPSPSSTMMPQSTRLRAVAARSEGGSRGVVMGGPEHSNIACKKPTGAAHPGDCPTRIVDHG